MRNLKIVCAALSAVAGISVSSHAFAGKPSKALLDFVALAAAQSVLQGPTLVPETDVVVTPPAINPTGITPTTPGGGNPPALLPPVRPPFRPAIRSPFTP